MHPPGTIETNWIIITGAPCSGKSSVIDAIEKRGYSIQRELAREIIEEMKTKGFTLDEISANQTVLQNAIIAREIQNQNSRDPHALIFMDRGMGDRVTYDRLLGLDSTTTTAAARAFHCRALFIMERLPLIEDGVRFEEESIVAKLDRMLEEDYVNLGYNPIRVPVLPIEERVQFIFAAIGV